MRLDRFVYVGSFGIVESVRPKGKKRDEVRSSKNAIGSLQDRGRKTKIEIPVRVRFCIEVDGGTCDLGLLMKCLKLFRAAFLF